MNTTPAARAGYRTLDTGSLGSWLAALPAVRERLGGAPERWTVREVGDGNLNLVFLVDGPGGSICVKQALPYLRVAGPSWPMTLERAYYEQSYYAAVAPHVGAAIPRVFHYDPERYAIVMECLTPHVILRRGLIAGHRYANVGRDIGDYVARAGFFTSDLAEPFERKFDRIARFAGNTDLVRISVDLIFTDPYCEHPRNRHTRPHLDCDVATLRGDAAAKAAAAELGRRFLGETQALIHGDLHSGSIMVTDADTRVIDPEFAFYGPLGFDLGAFLGNLVLAWCAQPGLASGAGERDAYRDWILEQAKAFWTVFRDRFLALWRNEGHGDAWPAAMFREAGDGAALETVRRQYLEALFADMLGYAACKMIRRVVGFAHVADLDGIADPALRARCERSALGIATHWLKRRQEYRSIEDTLAALPEISAR